MVTYEDEAFDSIIEAMIKDFLKLNPVLGTELGLHEYDLLAPDLSRESMELRITLIKKYIKELENIDKLKLTGIRAIDYDVVLSRMKEFLVFLEDWPLWRMYPVGFETVGEMLFPFLIRDHLPLEHRLEAMESRLKSIDKVILTSIENVDEPYRLWLKYVFMVSKGLQQLMDIVKDLGIRNNKPSLSEASEKAMDIISKMLGKLKDMESRAKPGFKPIGYELFEKLLKLRFIDEDINTLRRIGYEEAKLYKELMIKAAKEMNASSIEEAFSRIREKRARSKDEVFRIYKETIDKARKFIIERDLVEIPLGEKVMIVETPEYLRPIIPFAAYIPPETFSWSLTGIYLVTPPLTDEMFKHHNIYDIANTTVHEAYPGHHVQLIYTKLNPYTTRKVIVRAIDAIEGWAHYCEELMLEKGFNNTPEYKFKVYHDALWRAVRVYVDIELSTGMITFEEAVNKLVKDAYLPREGAYSEALRYTLSPTYQLCYNYGKRRIKKLRKRVKEILGSKYSDKLFHKLILEEGSLPLSVLEHNVLEKVRKLKLSIAQ